MDKLIEGRIVHFVMPSGEHRAAMVVRAWHNPKLELDETGLCNLIVFVDGTNDAKRSIDDPVKEPVLMQWETSKHYSKDPQPGTWHWIEEV